VPDPLLDVRDLYAGYGSLIVVRGVSFGVDEGTTTLILGLNGAGKTTTLKAIAGIVRPVRGSIIFNRKNVTATLPLGWTYLATARDLEIP